MGDERERTAEEYRLRDRLLQLSYDLRKRPEDIDLLKEMVGICEEIGDEEEAAEYRRRICRIDPGEPSIQGKRIAQRKPPVQAPESIDVPFWKDITRLKRYPLRGFGRPVLLGGGLGLALLRMLALIVAGALPPFSYYCSAIIVIIAWGLILSYFHHVTERSAQGEEEPPDWDDFRTFFLSMATPFFATLLTVVVMMGPAILWSLLCLSTLGFGSLTLLVLLILLLAGCFVTPMALLILARFNRVWAAIHPAFVYASIRKVMPGYLGLLVPLAILAFLNCLLAGILGLIYGLAGAIGVPILGVIIYYLVTSFALLYSGMIGFHMLGRFYLPHAKELNWFDEVLGAVPGGGEEP